MSEDRLQASCVLESAPVDHSHATHSPVEPLEAPVELEAEMALVELPPALEVPMGLEPFEVSIHQDVSVPTVSDPAAELLAQYAEPGAEAILPSAALVEAIDCYSAATDIDLPAVAATVEEAAIAMHPEPTMDLERDARTSESSAPVRGPITCFADLPLSEAVQQAVLQAGYPQPTAIQARIIPHMLAGRDVLAQSHTGSGKTAAFALPILSRIDLDRPLPQTLVLAPTRELAIQVAKAFSTYAACLPGFRVAAIYGGQEYEPQLKQLRRGVHVVVGTPGRVIDHIQRGTLDVSAIDRLVLDEADEMLNMGFLEDVQFILDQAPENRQIALFSATLPAAIRGIADRYQRDPAQITIKQKTVTAESIRQRALFVSPHNKIDALTRILEAEETDGVIVFTKTKDATISVAEQLNRLGLSAIALNGDMPQKVRERAIEQLKSGQLDILVATDVAARGLDVSRVSHVFNYDLPHDSESYIHRVGRTGRAGRKGEAIIFLTGSQRGKLRLIEKATGQPIEVVEPPTADEINAMRVARFKQRITDTTAEHDLTMFSRLIEQYAEESGKPMVMIAAALAHLGQQGRPFLMKDAPKRKHQDRELGREGRHARDRSDHGDGGFAGRAGRAFGPPRPGMQRYRIEVGRRDGVKVGNIVGAVANEAGLDGEAIGPIKIHDAFSTIDLPEGMPSDIYHTLRQTRVAGKTLRISLDAERGGYGRGKFSGGNAGGKPARQGHATQRRSTSTSQPPKGKKRKSVRG